MANEFLIPLKQKYLERKVSSGGKTKPASNTPKAKATKEGSGPRRRQGLGAVKQ